MLVGGCCLLAQLQVQTLSQADEQETQRPPQGGVCTGIPQHKIEP